MAHGIKKRERKKRRLLCDFAPALLASVHFSEQPS